MPDNANHIWRRRKVDRDAGVFADHVLQIERLSVWLNLDATIDGGPPDDLLLAHARSSLLTAASCTYQGDCEELAPEDLLELAFNGVPASCPRCGRKARVFASPSGRSGRLSVRQFKCRFCHERLVLG